jgi:hypothetical protein
MSRWITLTIDNLKAAGHGAIIDRARTSAVGGIDPVAQAIVKVTARVRRAVAPGNVLDADATKIPGSLEDAAVLIAIATLAGRIPIPLTTAMADEVRDARKELQTIAENKVKVELADTPETVESFAETGMKITEVNVPRRLTGRERTSGL